MPKNLGKLIVFEGIEGAGAETQTNLLINFLKNNKKSLQKLEYPDYQGPIGRLIHQFLHKRYDFSPEIQFLLYFSDFVKDKEKINQWLKEGKIIICDRYFSSALAYQGLQGFPIKEALKIAQFFEIPKPDFIVYLRVSPKTSIKRKLKEKQNLDRNESNKKLLTKVTMAYERLIKNQVLSRWLVINGEKSKGEVFKEIIQCLTPYLSIN